MDKGNKDLHRTSIKGSGLGRITESQKWGHEAAISRYGKLDDRNGASPPKDESRPQFKIDQPAKGSGGNTPEGWLTGKGGDGRGPNFAKTPPKFVK